MQRDCRQRAMKYVKKRIIICTIKTWNLQAAQQLRDHTVEKCEIDIVSDPEELIEKSKSLNPDFIFFPHWSYFIPKEIYENYKCIVFHMTDLPFGRGGSPLQNLIVRGYKSTKLSAIKVVKELDAGPIYMQQDLDLEGSAREIFARAADIVFKKMIPDIIFNNPVPKEQKGEIVVFRRRKPKDSEISVDMPLDKIYDYIRMLDAEGYPPAFIQFGKYHLNLTNACYRDGKLTANIEFMEDNLDE